MTCDWGDKNIHKDTIYRRKYHHKRSETEKNCCVDEI